MKLSLSRRHVLRGLGIQLALPLLSQYVDAAPMPRKRFIGIYVPNGAYMPGTVNGNFTWAEALDPLVKAGLKNNTMVFRGLFNGFGADPHWENTAAFLSCEPIQLGDPTVARCGKTVDQFVAEAYPAPLRSLEIGGIYYYIHPLKDHGSYSDDYLNRISWQSPDKFRSPIADPKQMFDRLFASDPGGAKAIAYARARKQSVLGSLLKDADRLQKRLPASYAPVLGSYIETVSEVEKDLANSANGASCDAKMAAPTASFNNPNLNYKVRFEMHHKMLVAAMQCGLTNAATLMYGPGVSDIMTFDDALGKGPGHHSAAHNGGDAGNIARVKAVNQLQVGLLADLLKRLKDASLLSETLVLYGSDMSDGDAHSTENLPVLLCGEGADLKFGQEIGDRDNKRPLSDLHVDIFSLLGVKDKTSFGSGRCKSTGMPLAIRA